MGKPIMVLSMKIITYCPYDNEESTYILYHIHIIMWAMHLSQIVAEPPKCSIYIHLLVHLSANWPSNVLTCYVYMDRLSRGSRKTTMLLIFHMYGETLYDVAQPEADFGD